jgi:hypothetical protein
MKKTMTILAAALLLLALGHNAGALTEGALEDRSSELAVKNPGGEYVGTISNALADPMGNITFVILSLGVDKGGDKNIVVPVYAFSHDGRAGLVLNMTDSQLAAAPEFRMSDLNDPTFGDRVYRFYGQVPPWSRGLPDSESE